LGFGFGFAVGDDGLVGAGGVVGGGIGMVGVGKVSACGDVGVGIGGGVGEEFTAIGVVVWAGVFFGVVRPA
jgi:hypothetical protein